MSERWLAARITTGEWLDTELPIEGDGPAQTRNGAGSMSGTIAPELGYARAADGELLLAEWGTALYYEVDGQIRWGGIVTKSDVEETEQSWSIEASEFAAYPTGIPYLGTYRPANGKVDAYVAFRHIWEYVQARPGCNLGLVIDDGTAGVLVGDPDHDNPFQIVGFDFDDCGNRLEDLCETAPMEFRESHTWAGTDYLYDTCDDATVWEWFHRDKGTLSAKVEDGVWLLKAVGPEVKFLARRPRLAFDPNVTYRVTARVRVQGVSPISVGVLGHDADGTGWANPDPADATGPTVYPVAAEQVVQTEAAGWVTYTGYFRGFAAHGATDPAPNPAAPAALQADVRYFRPVVVAYDGPALDIDYVRVDVLDAAQRVAHRMTLGQPRLGRRRDDLRFAQGENITVVPPAGRDGEDWASDVIIYAPGQDYGERLKAERSRDPGLRLRRWYAQSFDTNFQAVLNARAQRELTARAGLLEIPSITVTDSPHAPVAAVTVGDDILVRADLPHLGEVALWHRVMSRTIPGPGATSTLTLQRTEKWA